MILPIEEEEVEGEKEEEGDIYPLFRKTKEIENLAQDLMKESSIEGAKLITFALRVKALKTLLKLKF